MTPGNRWIPLLLGTLLLGWVPPAGGDPAVDPALRPLLRHAPGELRSLLTTAAAGGEITPVPRSLLPAGAVIPTANLDLFVTAGALPATDGMSVTPLGGDLYAVRATPEGLHDLAGFPGVKEIRLSRPLFPVLDRSATFLGLASVRAQDPSSGELSGLTGKGVVVGFVDSGLDWRHPDFQNPDGSTRLYTYWNQNSILGSPPVGYQIGVEWRAVSIDEGVLGGYDRTGHGTHVAGIAVGNGRSRNGSGSPLYTGIAPEATPIVVETNFTEFGAALGAHYVVERAAELGLPCVVNLSLGNQYGPHRGQTPLERSISSVVGPGRLVAAAAGNDGARPFHAEMFLDPRETGELRFRVPDYQKAGNDISFAALEGWFHPGARYEITVINPEGMEAGTFRLGDDDFNVADNRGFLRGWYVKDQGLTTFFLDVEDNLASFRRATGVWTLRIESLTDGRTELDFWIVNWYARGSQDLPAFVDHVDPEETVLSPASAPDILAVGAVATRTCWPTSSGAEACYDAPTPVGEVAPFSALGPTSDGRAKPELLAPGLGVIAPRSTYLAPGAYTEEQIARLSTPDQLYWINQGTSMAAPHVAGALALLLEKYPDMTVEQARARFRARVPRIEDPRTGAPTYVLAVAAAVAPPVSLTLSEIRIVPEGVRVEWFAGKESAPIRFEVWKGFDEGGPYFRLSSEPGAEGNPYSVLDPNPEPGRRQVYRIVAVDEAGLADDLDTLVTYVDGIPEPLLRAPDPNPAREAVNLRFFVPPSQGDVHYRLDVFDLQGRLVRELEAGGIGQDGREERIVWDLQDDVGRRVSGGLYFVRLVLRDGPGTTFIRRVVVLP